MNQVHSGSPDPEKIALRRFVRDYNLMDENEGNLETLVVLELNAETPKETLRWLYKKLTSSLDKGGAELVVRGHVDMDAESGAQIYFHVSGTTLRLLEIAESALMRRRDLNGEVRNFSIAEARKFLNEGDAPRRLFTAAERQRFATIALDGLRISPEEVEQGLKEFPGLTIPVSEGMPVVQSLRSHGVIKQLFYLHNPEKTKRLFKSCAKFAWTWHDDDVRNYFGESMALYFSFFHFYLKCLFFPALIGPVLFFLFEAVGILRGYAIVTACMVNLLWITVFFELWKRKNASLTYSWGTFGMHSYHEPLRPGFYGEMVRTASGRMEMRYPKWKTLCKEYLVSYPVMGLLAIAYLGLIYLETLADEMARNWDAVEGTAISNFATYLPSAVYGIVIYLLSGPTRSLAATLTSWENHATQNAWEMHLMMKLAAVEFVNLFASLFYIGFIIQNWESLRMQLAMLLLMHAFLENISEHLIPYLSQKSSVKKMQASLAGFINKKTGFNLLEKSMLQIDNDALPREVPRMDPDRWEIRQAQLDSQKQHYETKYDDYLEIWAQFGYAFMFSAVLPWTGLFCIIANCFEIVADLFKLCFLTQRPMAQRAKNIGVWKDAFAGLGVAAVSTNCALLALSPEVQALTPLSTDQTIVWPYLFILLEHGVFLVRNILAMIIPDVPAEVRKALASQEVSASEKRVSQLRQCLQELKQESSTDSKAYSEPLSDSDRLIKRRGESKAPVDD